MLVLCRRQLVRCFWTSTRALYATNQFPPQYLRRRTRPVLVRCFSAPVDHTNASTERYHALSDATMDSLLDSLESLLDGLNNDEYEVEYHSGVLTLSLGEHGTYVINKQPPNMQIWLSSPVSGPKRYDYSEAKDDWVYSRDGVAMGELLNNELGHALNMTVDLDISRIAANVEQ